MWKWWNCSVAGQVDHSTCAGGTNGNVVLRVLIKVRSQHFLSWCFRPFLVQGNGSPWWRITWGRESEWGVEQYPLVSASVNHDLAVALWCTYLTLMLAICWPEILGDIFPVIWQFFPILPMKMILVIHTTCTLKSCNHLLGNTAPMSKLINSQWTGLGLGMFMVICQKYRVSRRVPAKGDNLGRWWSVLVVYPGMLLWLHVSETMISINLFK